ncbi:hypothetical protein CQA62_06715 [Helicobacter cholecystus]|uniref:Uncharacterized protein n=1 Tax=Helicobacter cholecystus TaxID=45498 RepID=A0A3D8IQ89_9HELI|nr:hypothetical protein [Helicobacter cholecystus]RDU67448.1 hypothetical protein CQA62_06715 [Helicobacter cholecystus]VEJ24411.1 Uncharacterised protein [Helicobacter cholecystus]
MDLVFQKNLLKVWGWDKSVSDAWLFNLNEKDFWNKEGRRAMSLSVFSQRIGNPNDFLLDLMLKNQEIKMGIFKQMNKLLLEISESFKVFKPMASRQQIKLLPSSKRSLTLMLRKAIFDDYGGSIYIQDLDTLMYMPQDFTFLLITPQNAYSDFDLFKKIINKSGFFLYE